MTKISTGLPVLILNSFIKSPEVFSPLLQARDAFFRGQTEKIVDDLQIQAALIADAFECRSRFLPRDRAVSGEQMEVFIQAALLAQVIVQMQAVEPAAERFDHARDILPRDIGVAGIQADLHERRVQIVCKRIHLLCREERKFRVARHAEVVIVKGIL